MTLLQIAISLVLTELQNAKVAGAAVEIITNLEAALASLLKVHGTDVTFDGLESLRVKPSF